MAAGVTAVLSAGLIGTLASGAVYNRTGEIVAGFLSSIALDVFAERFLAGSAQWLILHRLVKRAGWWIPASGLGLILGWFVGALVGTPVVEDLVGFTNDRRTFQLVASITYAAATG